MGFQPSEAAQLVGISVNTVRAWTADPDYKPFFSISAQANGGRSRELTDTDIRVLAFMKQIKREGLVSEGVIAALKQAQARGFDLLPMPMQSDAMASTPVIPVQAAEQALAGERRVIDILDGIIQGLKSDLVKSEDDRNTLHLRLEQALEERARLKAEVDLYESGRLQPPTKQKRK